MNLDGLAYHLDGAPVEMHPHNDASKPAVHYTWGRIVSEAIDGPYRGDETLALSEKNFLGWLARKIQKGGDFTLKAETISKIKERVGKGLPPTLVHQICQLLDPEGEKEPVL